MKLLTSIAVFAAAALSAAADIADAPPAINIWSGREVAISGRGQWSLNAAHGRVIAAGTGKIELNLPPLEPGTTVNAKLLTDGMTERSVVIHSPQPLSAATFDTVDLGEIPAAQLVRLGMTRLTEKPAAIHVTELWPRNFTPGLTLVFPEKLEFPFELDNSWSELRLYRAAVPGTIGIALENNVQTLSADGDFTFAVLKRKGVTVAVFPPGFDWNDIDAVLLLKSVVEAEQK